MDYQRACCFSRTIEEPQSYITRSSVLQERTKSLESIVGIFEKENPRSVVLGLYVPQGSMRTLTTAEMLPRKSVERTSLPCAEIATLPLFPPLGVFFSGQVTSNTSLMPPFSAANPDGSSSVVLDCK